MKKATITEIKELLFSKEEIAEEIIKELYVDNRKGVKTLLNRWEKAQEEAAKEHERFEEMSSFEIALREKGIKLIAGVDEVGRGPIAGPVVASAVILDESFYLPGINDSKKLSEKKRELYYEKIMNEATSVGIGICSPAEIDELNIYQASKKAMEKAIAQLKVIPEYLLIDAMNLSTSIKQEAIIKGDAKSITIAAASVVAKVTRDRMMKELGKKHPQYGFENHVGYPTAEHIAALDKYGVLAEHRQSFAPVRERSHKKAAYVK